MQYFQKRACQPIKELLKSTFLALIDNYDYESKAGTDLGQTKYKPSQTRKFFDKLDQNQINWYISSFDPASGKVCVVVENPKGTQVITVTVQATPTSF